MQRLVFVMPELANLKPDKDASITTFSFESSDVEGKETVSRGDVERRYVILDSLRIDPSFFEHSPDDFGTIYLVVDRGLLENYPNLNTNFSAHLRAYYMITGFTQYLNTRYLKIKRKDKIDDR